MRLRTMIILLLGVGLAVGALLLHYLYLGESITFILGGEGGAGTEVTTPMTVVALGVILTSIAVLLCWKILSLVIFFPQHLRNWRYRWAEKRRAKILGEGLQAMVLGLRDTQQKSFSSAADAGVAPAVNYYLAAAATEDDKRQTALLRKAAKADGDPMVQAMATARLRLKSNMPAEAAEVLRIAGAATHKASEPMRLLLEANERSGDIRGALDVAQHLLERDPSPMLRHRIGKLTSELLADAGNADAVRGLLGTVSKSGQSPAAIAIAAAKRLAAVGDEPGASAILAQALRQSPDIDTLEAISKYGSAELVQTALGNADELLRDQPGNTDLLRALADLAARAKLWGQARRMLEEALAIKEERGTYLRMAKLAEEEGKPGDEASRLYRLAAQAGEA